MLICLPYPKFDTLKEFCLFSDLVGGTSTGYKALGVVVYGRFFSCMCILTGSTPDKKKHMGKLITRFFKQSVVAGSVGLVHQWGVACSVGGGTSVGAHQ